MRAYLFAILLCVGAIASGQKSDAMLWTGIAAKAKLIKPVSIKYETQTRFYNNMSQLSQYYNEFSVDYEPIKNLETGIIYRYSRKNKTTHFIGENRIALDVGYGYKIGETGLEIKGRARYQYAFDRLSVINDVIFPNYQHMFRFKTKIQYKNSEMKRIKPYASYEFYSPISPKNSISKLDTYRCSFGLDFDLPYKMEASLYYIFEHENRSVINLNHIYGFQISYSFGKLIDSGEGNKL